ncbi:MAG: efflux RND transporter periplasmic adaptor subunit [Planctomycetota bacterium]
MDSPIVSTLPAGYQMDRQYGLIYDRIPARTDDLTRISGLQQREAALLNSQGVFCFGQIALWRHREQVRFAEELQIPFSRIVDEGWVSQARDLCRERRSAMAGFTAGSFRSLTTLICALLIGFLFVWLLASRQHAPLAGILIADVTQVRLPADALVQHVHVRPGDEVFTGQKLLTVENSALLADRIRQQKLVREAERAVQRLEAQALLERESRRAELAAATAGLQQDLLRQRGGRSLARTGAAGARGGGGILFFSASSKSTPLSAVSVMGQRPETRATGSPAPGPRIVAAASPTVLADPGRSNGTATAKGNANATGTAGDASGSEALRTELARLESLQKNLDQHVEAAVGLTQAREVLLEVQEELQRLQTAETELLIPAPGYGLVGTVNAQVGDHLNSGSTVVRILHPDRRSVVVQLPGARLPELSPGEEVQVHFPGARGFTGRVSTISPMTSAESDGAETRIAVKIEPAGRIWPMVPVGCEVQVSSWK